MTDDARSADTPTIHIPLDGRDYRALVRLSNAGDETLADVGDSCDRVPPASLVWLLADGLIERVSEPRVH